MSKRGSEELLVSPDTERSFKKMDNTTTPNKMDITDSERQNVMKDIENSAPEWFLQAFSHLTSELKVIRENLSGIESFKADVNKKFERYEDRITVLESKAVKREETIKELKNQVIKLETYTRQQNLLLDGIPESPNENLTEKIALFFMNELKIKDGDRIKFARIHRLGKPPHLVSHTVFRPRTVIVKFESFADRDKVWRASWEQRGRKFIVREDYPEGVRESRKQLLPCLQAAKRDTSVKHCSLKLDKLHIDGRTYSVEDYQQIPERFKWHYKGVKYIKECNSTFFFGSISVLSNHYNSPFKDGKTLYTCAEQYYLQQKSLFFDDVETANAIMGQKEPSKMKALSYRIKNLDEEAWLKQASKVMENACYLKFHQNPELKEKLIATKGDIVEANRRDFYFSCGLSLSDPNIMDINNWKGRNVLGKILTSLRKKFGHLLMTIVNFAENKATQVTENGQEQEKQQADDDVTSVLSDSQRKQLKDLFNRFDVDKNGSISVTELGEVVRAFGWSPTEKLLGGIIEEFDGKGNQNGTLELNEFMALMVNYNFFPSQENIESEEQEILEAFRFMDRDNSGTISAQNLMEVLTELGDEPLTKEQAQEIISDADTNGDGELDYMEFKAKMTESLHEFMEK